MCWTLTTNSVTVTCTYPSPHNIRGPAFWLKKFRRSCICLPMFPPSLISLYECDSQRGKMRAIDTIETNEQKLQHMFKLTSKKSQGSWKVKLPCLLDSSLRDFGWKQTRSRHSMCKPKWGFRMKLWRFAIANPKNKCLQCSSFKFGLLWDGEVKSLFISLIQ